MSIKEKLETALKRIWEDNDLEAVDFFRTVINDGRLTLYSEKQAGFTRGKYLFYNRDEPILHLYSLNPLSYKIELEQLISLIDKNDVIGIELFDVDQTVGRDNSAHVDVHPRSGLVHRAFIDREADRDTEFLFPLVVRSKTDPSIDINDFVEYTTLVDQRSHCGQVVEIRNNMLMIKEYTGFHFAYDDCNYDIQDVWEYDYGQNCIVCLPIDACKVLDADDFRFEEVKHALIIREIWREPCADTLEEFREWFTKKAKAIHVYYLVCEDDRRTLNCPEIYIVRELVQIEKKRLEQVYKDKWLVVKTTISEFVRKHPSDSYTFLVDGLYNSSGYISQIKYSPTDDTVTVHFEEVCGSTVKYYPHVVDVGNQALPNKGSIISYPNNDQIYRIAKVLSISKDMVCITDWRGNAFQLQISEFLEEVNETDEWFNNDYLYIPLYACKMIADIELSEQQIKSLIRFENKDVLVDYPPYTNFVAPKKLKWTIEDFIVGLKRINQNLESDYWSNLWYYEHQWHQFISEDYLKYYFPPLFYLNQNEYRSFDLCYGCDHSDCTNCKRHETSPFYDAITFFECAKNEPTGFVYSYNDIIVIEIVSSDEKTIIQIDEMNNLLSLKTARELWDDKFADQYKTKFDEIEFVGMFYSWYISQRHHGCVWPKLQLHFCYRGIMSDSICKTVAKQFSSAEIDSQCEEEFKNIKTLLKNYLE